MKHWPEQFLKVYIDDAMGERLWVDQPECRQFVENILTAFNTILPPSIKNGEEGGGLACPSPPTGSSSGSRTPTRTDEEVQVIDLPINREPVEELGVMPRYSAMQDVVEQITLGVVREQLNRRTQGQQSENITRNFIRLLTFASGLPEIRKEVAVKLEMWLINPKISRYNSELSGNKLTFNLSQARPGAAEEHLPELHHSHAAGCGRDGAADQAEAQDQADHHPLPLLPQGPVRRSPR